MAAQKMPLVPPIAPYIAPIVAHIVPYSVPHRPCESYTSPLESYSLPRVLHRVTPTLAVLRLIRWGVYSHKLASYWSDGEYIARSLSLFV
jgi:hypothetical protein